MRHERNAPRNLAIDARPVSPAGSDPRCGHAGGGCAMSDTVPVYDGDPLEPANSANGDDDGGSRGGDSRAAASPNDVERSSTSGDATRERGDGDTSGVRCESGNARDGRPSSPPRGDAACGGGGSGRDASKAAVSEPSRGRRDASKAAASEPSRGRTRDRSSRALRCSRVDCAPRPMARTQPPQRPTRSLRHEPPTTSPTE